jgi:hypothetical protein
MEIMMIQNGQTIRAHGAFFEDIGGQDTTIAIRTFRRDDLDALLDLTNRAWEADPSDRRMTLDDLRHDFENPNLQPESSGCRSGNVHLPVYRSSPTEVLS